MMILVKNVLFRVKQFGGIRMLRGYARLGVLTKVLCTVFPGVFFKHYNTVHQEVLKIVCPAIKNKYQKSLEVIIKQIESRPNVKEYSRIVWVCWLQGIDKAPDIVKICLSSLKSNLKRYDIRVIDESNISQYVKLPKHIQKRWKLNQIPPALYTDIIRLELLIKYGGTWIDSTVLCTGNVNDNFMKADLFVFQYTRHGCLPVSISNWFITSCSNNEVLKVLREMLYLYWKDFDCVVYYYIFHLFFSMISERMPQAIINMPYGNSSECLALQRHLGDDFNSVAWERLISKVQFHKLTYRLNDKIKEGKGNYYNFLKKAYKDNAI